MKNLVNQSIVQEQRTKYMNHELTHRQYYAWLAKFIGATKKMVPADPKLILRSTDPYFNDIPMHLWDSVHPRVQRMAWNMGLAWSNSDSVCVLKELANQIKDEAITQVSSKGN